MDKVVCRNVFSGILAGCGESSQRGMPLPGMLCHHQGDTIPCAEGMEVGTEEIPSLRERSEEKTEGMRGAGISSQPRDPGDNDSGREGPCWG